MLSPGALDLKLNENNPGSPCSETAVLDSPFASVVDGTKYSIMSSMPYSDLAPPFTYGCTSGNFFSASC